MSEIVDIITADIKSMSKSERLAKLKDIGYFIQCVAQMKKVEANIQMNRNPLLLNAEEFIDIEESTTDNTNECPSGDSKLASQTSYDALLESGNKVQTSLFSD